MTPKLITVFGATGAQGGAVVAALRRDAYFRVRAVSRDVDGEAGQALRDIVVETLHVDLDDADSVARALAGAYGCFLVTVTDFTRPDFYATEVKQVLNAMLLNR